MKFLWCIRTAGRQDRIAALLLGAAVLICGCARERVSVTLGNNGTWTRKAVYVVTNMDIGAGESKTSEVSDAFALPAGEGWKLTSQKTRDEKRVVAERTLRFDQTLENDIVVKESPKTNTSPGQDPGKKDGTLLIRADDPPAPLKTLTTNSVTVKNVSPGRYSYTETIHWTGERPASMHQFDETQTALVKAALPPALASDENVKLVADTFAREVGLALVGPPSPLIHRMPMLMSAPDMFARLISRRAGKGLMAALKAQFGDRMTGEQRRALTSRLIEGFTQEIKTSGPSQAGNAQGGENSKNSSAASIFISVKLPGRVIETNGIADAFNGDITWSFYPEAAAFGDVTLTAICDSNTKTESR